ncbi:21 kDa protein [Quillaja saponaria]|uniref:pectinesterase n=1 Tax=Quillaja saponaria TaxID=32244 RepID=A0AAD7Q9T0_QUISA|nr:21 kDa protein [Quillaja saponaria]
MVRMALLLGIMLLGFLTNVDQFVSGKENHYVRDACSVTRYKDLCAHSLASFSNIAKRSPTKWARAGVSVTIAEVKIVAADLKKLKRNWYMRGRNRVALSDCIDCFSDALDELHRSLGVLRWLSKTTFGTQMGDINTWISAALTDEDTCLDGFEGQKGKRIRLPQNQVLNATYITCNALALVNKLASTGLGSITNP